MELLKGKMGAKAKEKELDKTIEMFEIDPAMIEVDIDDIGKSKVKKGSDKKPNEVEGQVGDEKLLGNEVDEKKSFKDKVIIGAKKFFEF
jgi:hypothetical protein